MKNFNEVIFKPFHFINIAIYALLIIGMLYFFVTDRYDTKYVSIMGSVIFFLLFLEVRSQLRYKYLLKINNKVLSYKEDKKIIRLEDIESFVGIPGMLNTPSKLIIETTKGTEELTLQNYNKIKVDKISKALNEKLSQLANR